MTSVSGIIVLVALGLVALIGAYAWAATHDSAGIPMTLQREPTAETGWEAHFSHRTRVMLIATELATVAGIALYAALAWAGVWDGMMERIGDIIRAPF